MQHKNNLKYSIYSYKCVNNVICVSLSANILTCTPDRAAAESAVNTKPVFLLNRKFKLYYLLSTTDTVLVLLFTGGIPLPPHGVRRHQKHHGRQGRVVLWRGGG